MNEVEISTPHKLFEETLRLRAPVFQRFYVWGETQLDQMLDDIDDVEDPKAERKEFLGAIVLQDLGATGGVMSAREALMIDGQQRLTTIFMLLSALCGIAKKSGDSGTASNISETYLTLGGSRERRGRPKLVPTSQDCGVLWKRLRKDVPSAQWKTDLDPGEGVSKGSKIEKQWDLIWSKLERTLLKRNGKLDRKEFERFSKSLLHGLQFVVITLDAADDANLIFSKLNARGEPLKLSDLVRNEVFLRFKQGQARDAHTFHGKYWAPFERSFGEVRRLDDFFLPFATVKFRGKVTKTDAFPKLQESWAPSGKNKDARIILKELQRYAPYYAAMYDPKPGQFRPRRLGDAVERFSRMPKTSVTWPFLMQVLDANGSGALTPVSAAKCFEIVESFLVRRAICGYEPTGLHAIFKTLWNRTKGEPRRVVANIVSKTVVCPDDDEVKSTLHNDDCYTRKVLPFILREREYGISRAGGYDVADAKITVEHVLPQEMSPAWARLVTREDHGALLGTLGNLVPLSGKQNSGVGNEAWEKKRKRYKGSAFHFAQEAAEEGTWDAATIRKRNGQWYRWFVRRWPHIEEFS